MQKGRKCAGQKNSHAIPQFLKELNLVGLVEKHCVAIAKFCLPALLGKPGNGGQDGRTFISKVILFESN